MVTTRKLYGQSLGGRNLTFREFTRLAEAFGFRLDRVVGSHHIYVHPDIDDQLNVQSDGKDAKRYQVRQFLAMIDANGLALKD